MAEAEKISVATSPVALALDRETAWQLDSKYNLDTIVEAITSRDALSGAKNDGLRFSTTSRAWHWWLGEVWARHRCLLEAHNERPKNVPSEL